MAIHMEVEYAKRFEGGGQDSSSGGSSSAGGEEGESGEEAQSPLPPKADVSWAHILAQNQVRLERGGRGGAQRKKENAVTPCMPFLSFCFSSEQLFHLRKGFEVLCCRRGCVLVRLFSSHPVGGREG